VNTLLDLRERIKIFDSQNRRWDQEWLQYFIESNPKVYFVSFKDLTLIGDVRGKTPLEVHNTDLVSSAKLGNLGNLRVWMDGDHLVGKNLLEIGCGAGYSGKQLGLLAASYIGIDYSQLALSIARLTSPENCVYYHMSDLEQIVANHAGTLDVMVSRDFFIHQNYANAIPILRLASLLLKPDGLITADFWLTRPYGYQPVTHPAQSELDPQYPSCSFLFSMEDIEQAARETDLVIQSITDIPDWRRRFVIFSKQTDNANVRPTYVEFPSSNPPEEIPQKPPQETSTIFENLRAKLVKAYQKVVSKS
jgi:2-polyprenyl-3-methyl-5-hydroxy-6-metoxy-1,4-benzoquinol methylase